MLPFIIAAVVSSSLVGVMAKGGRRAEEERANATRAYYTAYGELRALKLPTDDSAILSRAVEVYIELYGWDKGTRALREFIHRWVQTHKFGDVHEISHGQPRKITPEECEQCITELRGGYFIGKGKHLFSSLDHAAESGICPTVKLCLARYSASGMWRRLQDFDNQLIHLKPIAKKPIPLHIKAERVDCCKLYLDKYDNDFDYFKRIFFIDQKTLLMHPQSGWCIAYRDDKEDWVVELDDVRGHSVITNKSEVFKVEFYAMVNWYGGMVDWQLCQGTTGNPRHFKVSHPPQRVLLYRTASDRMGGYASWALEGCGISRHTYMPCSYMPRASNRSTVRLSCWLQPAQIPCLEVAFHHPVTFGYIPHVAPPPLQTKEGNVAKTFSAAEVNNVMTHFQCKAIQVIEEQFKGDETKINEMQPIFSLDNAPVHCDVEEIFGVGSRVPLPPYSPDMHKVIEHVFNYVRQYVLVQRLPALAADNVNTPQSRHFWPALVEEALFTVTAESIREDISSLRDTYEYILKFKGARAPKPFN